MEKRVMDVRQIMQILPHRYPFLLVDRVLELEPGMRVVAIKNITVNEPQFTGHWPGNPVMPGVLILEAMAQAGGIMLLCQPEDRGKVPFFGGVDQVRWRRRVVPGDQLVLSGEVRRRKGNIGRAWLSAQVEGEVVCEGLFTFALLDPDDPND